MILCQHVGIFGPRWKPHTGMQLYGSPPTHSHCWSPSWPNAWSSTSRSDPGSWFTKKPSTCRALFVFENNYCIFDLGIFGESISNDLICKTQIAFFWAKMVLMDWRVSQGWANVFIEHGLQCVPLESPKLRIGTASTSPCYVGVHLVSHCLVITLSLRLASLGSSLFVLGTFLADLFRGLFCPLWRRSFSFGGRGGRLTGLAFSPTLSLTLSSSTSTAFALVLHACRALWDFSIFETKLLPASKFVCLG